MVARPVPPGAFSWGSPGGPAAAVERVRRACREADGHDPLDEASLLRLKHHGLRGSRLWLVAEDGFALSHRSGDTRAVDLAVAPAARGRGLGRDLAAASLAPSGPVQAWSHGNHPAAARLAAAYGLARVRELWLMRRPMDTPLPPPRERPGVTVRGYRDADAPELLRVNAAAFAAHPEQGGLDAASLAERMAEGWFDPAGLLVATEAGPGGDERMLGFHWTKRHSPTAGEVYVVGIDPEAQGRGLGSLLTLAGLHHLRRGGVAEVHLYVESDNRPAIAVYTGLGFAHADADTHVMFARPGAESAQGTHVQPDLRVDDDLLGGGDPVGDERGVDRDVPLQ